MLKKMTGNEKVSVAVSAVLLVLFIGAAVLAAVLFRELASTESDFSEYRSRTEIELSDLEKKKNAAGVSLTELQSQLALAEKTEEELEKLRTSFSDTDQLYRQLTQQLEELQGTLLEKQTEIDGLRADVRELEKIYSVNLNRQIEIIKELEVLLTDGAPMNAVETPVLDEEGVPMIGENGEPVTEIHYEYPRIAVYYEDLGRGYRYEWNGDISFNSASCVKAPFALAILKEASAERAEYDRQLAEYIAVNGPVEALPDYTPKFDFDQIFTYTEKDYKAGSGVIKDAEFGTEYTYLELIRLMLKNSDNVAFSKLRDVYGVSTTKSLAKSLGTKAMRSNVQRLGGRSRQGDAGDLRIYRERRGLRFLHEGDYAVLDPYRDDRLRCLSQEDRAQIRLGYRCVSRYGNRIRRSSLCARVHVGYGFGRKRGQFFRSEGRRAGRRSA